MEVEGWASLPQPLLQEAAAYRIDDLYYYSSSYSHVTLRHPFPFLLSCSPFRAPPPLPFHSLVPFSASHHACRIFLRKIDRFFDHLPSSHFPPCLLYLRLCSFVRPFFSSTTCPFAAFYFRLSVRLSSLYVVQSSLPSSRLPVRFLYLIGDAFYNSLPATP